MQKDATSPSEGTADEALSFADGVEDITDLLEDPETDPSADDQDQEAEAEPVEGEEAEANAEHEEEAEEQPDGSEDPAHGRFVSKDAKVRLDDGTVTTVAELARNNLFQRDYTRKTQELSQERQTFETQRQQVVEHARTLGAQRDFLLKAAKQFLPAPPDKSMIDTDFIGYQHAVVDYQEKMSALQQLQQLQRAEQERQSGEVEQKRRQVAETEAKKLVAEMPELAKPENYEKFWREGTEALAEYGFTADEIASLPDHRIYKVMRDLVKYRKARQQAPKVQQDVQNRPKLMTGGKRMDPKAKNSREQQMKSERLRKTGSMNDAVAALMDLDL